MSSNIFSDPMLQGLTPNRIGDDENDPRYEHELPPYLGKYPSKKALKALFNSYGGVFLSKITNNSDHVVQFKNPYKSTSGDIQPGKSESKNCKGYIPLWSSEEYFSLNYYNQAFSKYMTTYIKDLQGDWLISFWTNLVDEDIRRITPPNLEVGYSSISLTINKNGYEIYNETWNEGEGGITWV